MKEYFLFGAEATAAYHENLWKQFLPMFRTNKDIWDYQLYNHDHILENAGDVLFNYDGWNGWAVITEEEYKQLDKIRNGN